MRYYQSDSEQESVGNLTSNTDGNILPKKMAGGAVSDRVASAAANAIDVSVRSVYDSRPLNAYDKTFSEIMSISGYTPA